MPTVVNGKHAQPLAAQRLASGEESAPQGVALERQPATMSLDAILTTAPVRRPGHFRRKDKRMAWSLYDEGAFPIPGNIGELSKLEAIRQSAMRFAEAARLALACPSEVSVY